MPNDTPGESQEAPKYITAEEVGNIVNSAVTAHLRRFSEKQLPELLTASLKPITDKLAATPVKTEDDAETPKGKSKNKDPEVLAMAQKLDELTNTIKERDAQVAATNKKMREDRAFTELRASLEGKVRPELLDMVAKHIFVVEGLVEVDEQGTPLFKSKQAPYIGADPEEVRLPLKAGVETFLKSESAKPFLPAPSTSGASPLPKRGTSPTPGGIDFSKPATTDAEKAARSIERERQAKERLGANQ